MDSHDRARERFDDEHQTHNEAALIDMIFALRCEYTALLARVEQLTRRVTDLEGNAVCRDEPECVHEWSRFPSNPAIPRCVICRTPYNPAIHNPAVPDSDPPIRSFSDWDIELHEQQRAA